MKLTGHVTRKILYAGTKSEHEALVLVTPAGEYKLRRQGGNPFRDDTLAVLEGKQIEGEGVLRQSQFILSSWKTVG